MIFRSAPIPVIVELLIDAQTVFFLSVARLCVTWCLELCLALSDKSSWPIWNCPTQNGWLGKSRILPTDWLLGWVDIDLDHDFAECAYKLDRLMALLIISQPNSAFRPAESPCTLDDFVKLITKWPYRLRYVAFRILNLGSNDSYPNDCLARLLLLRTSAHGPT